MNQWLTLAIAIVGLLTALVAHWRISKGSKASLPQPAFIAWTTADPLGDVFTASNGPDGHIRAVARDAFGSVVMSYDSEHGPTVA